MWNCTISEYSFQNLNEISEKSTRMSAISDKQHNLTTIILAGVESSKYSGPNMWESQARVRHNLPHLTLSPVSACALYTGDWVSLVCTASIPFHSCHWFVIFWYLEKFQLGQRKSLFKLCIDFEALKSPIYNRKKDTINVVTSILILKCAWVLWNMFSNFLLLF